MFTKLLTVSKVKNLVPLSSHKKNFILLKSLKLHQNTGQTTITLNFRIPCVKIFYLPKLNIAVKQYTLV